MNTAFINKDDSDKFIEEEMKSIDKLRCDTKDIFKKSLKESFMKEMEVFDKCLSNGDKVIKKSYKRCGWDYGKYYNESTCQFLRRISQCKDKSIVNEIMNAYRICQCSLAMIEALQVLLDDLERM